MKPTDVFSDVIAGTKTVHISTDRVPRLAEVERACIDALECSGLRYQGRPEDSRHSHKAYCLVPLDSVALGIRDVVRWIADKHGPGKLWTFGARVLSDGRRVALPVSYLSRMSDHDSYRGATMNSVEYVMLGCYYNHAPIEAR